MPDRKQGTNGGASHTLSATALWLGGFPGMFLSEFRVLQGFRDPRIEYLEAGCDYLVNEKITE